MTHPILPLLCLLLIAPTLAESGERHEPTALLADGLDGWAYSDEKQQDAWSLDDDILRTTGKPNGYIRTKEKYGDFILKLDIRHPERAGNSGILFCVIGEDKVWPRCIEAQGQKGDLGDIHLLGGFAAFHNGELKGGGRLPRREGVEEKPVGEWNAYEIRMRGGGVELYVNGKLANRVTDADAEPGYIALQSEGVPVEFRDLKMMSSEPDAAAPQNEPAEPVELFNGEDLTGWSGREGFWRVEDGTIIGETSKDNPTKGNTFLVYTGDPTLKDPPTFGDFDLSFEYRLSPDTKNNSGVQYRSQHIKDHVVKGYQFDMQRGPEHMGKLYDEKGRGRVAMAGERVTFDTKKNVTGRTASEEELKGAEREGWNTGTVIARGNRLIHKVNGVTVVDFTDEDEKNREASGLIALQLHAGEPMRIEFRNLKLTPLDVGATR